MADPNENIPATVPDQPESKPPLRKSMPVVIVLIVIVALIGIANISSLVGGNKRATSPSSLTMSPTTPNAQQVTSFQSQQQAQARHDAEERQRQQELAAAMQQLQQEQGAPGPESATTPPMTAAQRATIYGESPNAPQRTSNLSEAQAEAKQKRLAIEKQQQDDVVEQALSYVFSKDRDFQEFLKSPEAQKITPTLRVRKPAVNEVAEQPARRPVSPASPATQTTVSVAGSKA